MYTRTCLVQCTPRASWTTKLSHVMYHFSMVKFYETQCNFKAFGILTRSNQMWTKRSDHAQKSGCPKKAILGFIIYFYYLLFVVYSFFHASPSLLLPFFPLKNNDAWKNKISNHKIFFA